MNPKTNIRKKQLKAKHQEPVFIKDYMMFLDEETKEKSMLIHLQSHTFYAIDSIDIEITQFDEKMQKLSQATYLFDQLHIKNRGSVVPYQKIKLHQACESIESRLIRVKTTQQTWENNAWQAKPVLDIHKNKKNIKFPGIKHNQIQFPFIVTFFTLIIFFLLVVAVYKLLNP